MKKFILFTLLCTSNLLANELKDIDLKNKFISVLKDVEIEKLLEGSTEVQDCLNKNKFTKTSGATPASDAKAREAETCFKEKLKNKSEKELKELSAKLGLKSFGLVPSDNVQDISEYLGDKMWEAMTNVNRKDNRNKEMLKFKNRKLIDQKVFFQLYTTQLGKNALFEISRFCFQNLRKENEPQQGDNFVTYWADVMNGANLTVLDTGDLKWGSFSDSTSKEKIYKDIFNGIGTGFNPEKLGKFHTFCMNQIKDLCKKFENETNKKDNPNGANACLTKAKLQEIRHALSNTELILEQFNKDFSDGTVVVLDKVDGKPQKPQWYDHGKEDDRKSIDNLTNVTSMDILEGGKKEQQQKLQEKCTTEPGASDCEGFLVVDDSGIKAEHTLDMEMRLKKEVEQARIRQLKTKGQQEMKDYLTENGYFDLLEQWEKGELNNDNIEAAMEKIFEAKREAALKAIRNKISKRQITEEEAESSKPEGVQKMKQENAKEALEERARIAQVLLFNNIIVSRLELKKKGTGEDAGRNIGGLKKEMEELDKVAGSIDPELFQNLKNSVKEEKSGIKSDTIVGLEIIDSILGKK